MAAEKRPNTPIQNKRRGSIAPAAFIAFPFLIYPQITQINADFFIFFNLRKSA
jgi:hypothetical protein